jgi:outer membrane protein OmpU
VRAFEINLEGKPMKKVLFATTALIATAGMASADITWGGFGRFGVVHNEGNAGNETYLTQRMRLTVTGTSESDAGVKFEGRMRIESNEDATDANADASATGFGAAGFAVTSGGFRLDVGSVSNVIDSGDMVAHGGASVGMQGFIGNNTGFGLPANGFGTGNDVDPIIKLRYSAGDLTASASYRDADEQTQVGLGYNFGNYSAGIVMGNDNAANTDFVAASLTGSVGAAAFAFLVADNDANASTSVGLTVAYDMSAATELRFAVSDSGAAGADTAYAVGFRHSLGGGVSLQGGVGEDNGGNSRGDLGVVFNF